MSDLNPTVTSTIAARVNEQIAKNEFVNAPAIVADVYKSFRGHEIPEDMYLSAVLGTANQIRDRVPGFNREQFIIDCGVDPDTLEDL